MSNREAELPEKEWCVDWEVQVEISLTKTVTMSAAQILEGATADEALETAKAELESMPEIDTIDISSQVEPEDFVIESVHMDTFRLTTPVTEWSA